MEPLNPNDPLWKLLGQARPVEPRSNFVANVVRQARQTPQDTSWWARMSAALTAWFASAQRPALIGAATMLVVTAAAMLWERPVSSPDVAAVTVPEVQSAVVPMDDSEFALIADDVAAPLENLDHMDALVAVENTSQLSDSQLAFLLY